MDDEITSEFKGVVVYTQRRGLDDDSTLTYGEHHLIGCAVHRYRGDPYTAADHIPFTPKLILKRWKRMGYRKLPSVEKRDISTFLMKPITVNYTGDVPIVVNGAE